MDKQHILDEIRRTATDGRPLGYKAFGTTTGIKTHHWRGKHWARWGDALTEAGYSPNSWGVAHEEPFILTSLAELTEKLGKYPTLAEIDLERKANRAFPSAKAIGDFAGKARLVDKVREFCRTNARFENVLPLLEGITVRELRMQRGSGTRQQVKHGYVYLLATGKKYKIGHSISPLSRAVAISNMNPIEASIEHLIRTDDPKGIEDYWHRRFAEKRINGEWFALNATDVAAFKRRRFM